MINCILHRLKNLFNFQDKAGRLDFFCSSIVIIFSVIVANETFNFFWAQIYIIFAAFLMLVLHIQRLNHLGEKKKNSIFDVCSNYWNFSLYLFIIH